MREIVRCVVCGEIHDVTRVGGLPVIACPKVDVTTVAGYFIPQSLQPIEVVSDPCPPEPAPSATTPPTK